MFLFDLPNAGTSIRLFGGMNLTDLSILERGCAERRCSSAFVRFLIQNGGTCAVKFMEGGANWLQNRFLI